MGHRGAVTVCVVKLLTKQHTIMEFGVDLLLIMY